MKLIPRGRGKVLVILLLLWEEVDAGFILMGAEVGWCIVERGGNENLIADALD